MAGTSPARTGRCTSCPALCRVPTPCGAQCQCRLRRAGSRPSEVRSSRRRGWPAQVRPGRDDARHAQPCAGHPRRAARNANVGCVAPARDLPRSEAPGGVDGRHKAGHDGTMHVMPGLVPGTHAVPARNANVGCVAPARDLPAGPKLPAAWNGRHLSRSESGQDGTMHVMPGLVPGTHAVRRAMPM